MGGSSLRALAFGKPLVVQGEYGFWRTLTPESAALFGTQGWFGVGDGSDGVPRLTAALADLLQSPEDRARLGAYGRDLVVSEYSLTGAAGELEEWYEHLLARPDSLLHRLAAAGRTVPRLGRLGVYKVRRRRARSHGTVATDDFNVVART